MAIEYELKFRTTPQQQAQILSAIAGTDRHYTMQTTYYDTPSGSLSQPRYTLRKRMENHTCVCTLKAPAQAGRSEWEVNCDRIEDAIPMLCKLGAPEALPSLVQEGLIPVCAAAFRRIARTVITDNCTLELALDTGHLTGGQQTLPLCEVEVELKSGAFDDCDAFAADLARRFALEEEPHSKFRRALALYKGE